MQKYILRKALKKTEIKEVEAENWDEAVIKLNEFLIEPFPDDCTLLHSECHAEFIGDA